MDSSTITFFYQTTWISWPLYGLFFLSVLFLVERFIFLHRSQIKAPEFVSGIKSLLRNNRLKEAIALCEEHDASVPKVLRSALILDNPTEEQLNSAMRRTALLELPRLQKRLFTLGFIAKLAPLLGLLGTVIALIKAYIAYQVAGGYVPMDAVQEQVYFALSSTALGLIVTIIAGAGHTLLVNRVRSIVYDVEWSSEEFMQFLLYDISEK